MSYYWRSNKRSKQQIDLEHKNYVRGKHWKCPDSPTGAHHWLIDDASMRCRWCGIVRERGNSNVEKVTVQGNSHSPA